jgi:hypothetical protein
MNIYFATFGNNAFSKSRERIANEAKNFGIFKNIFAYDNIDAEYIEKHLHFIKKNPRGFGCWIWKPYIILKSLEKINDNDILLYCDAGCSLNVEGKKRMMEYIEMVSNHKSGLLCFQLNDFHPNSNIPLHPEKRWNKRDTIEEILGEVVSNEVLDSSQCEAGMIFVRKCKESLNLLTQWLYYCQQYHLIDDSPSIKKNDPIFREHRHDQSIWSLLVKKYGVLHIPDETYWHPNWSQYKHFPIHARRLKN